MRHRGIALLTVMVVLMLCSLTVIAAARLGLLHDMLTGHQADQLRAQAAAEALMRDAEADILGMFSEGRLCAASENDLAQAKPGFVGCRERGTEILPANPYFPQNTDEFDEVRALLQVSAALPCRDGICVPSSLDALAGLEDALPSMEAAGARYGQFTRAGLAPGTGNPLLAVAPARGWYWIEIFRYHTGADALSSTHHAQPDPARPFVYRITTVAHGLKPGTRAVMKSLFVPHPSAQLP